MPPSSFLLIDLGGAEGSFVTGRAV